MLYFDILEEFYKAGVKYLIVGGMSVNLHGIPRVTQDIDFIVSTDKKNVLKVISILKTLGYIPLLPVNPEDMAEPGRVKE